MFNKNNLRQFRKKKRTTQIELARRTGLTKDTISNLERGIITNPYLSTVCKLARYFNVSIESLCNYCENRK